MKKLFAILCLASLTLPAGAESRWLGDVNGDYEVNEADVTALVQMLTQKKPLPQEISLLDVNKDHQLTLADLTSLIALVNALKAGTAEKEYIPETIDVGGKGGFD